jgi:ATP-binding cassette subfamily C protein LapB
MRVSTPAFNALRGQRGELIAASCALNLLSLALPIALLQVYDRVIPNSATETLSLFALALGVVLLLDLMLSLCRSYLSSWTGARIQYRMSCATMDHLIGNDIRAFEAIPVGVHLQRIRAIDSVKTFLAGQGLLLTVDLPFALMFFLLIGLIAGSLVLVPVAILILLGFAAYATGIRLGAALEHGHTIDDRRYNFLIEVLRKIHTIKGLGLETLMVRRYELLQASSARTSFQRTSAGASARNTGHLFSQITAAGVGAYGSTLVIDNSLTIGALAACTLLASRSAQPMIRALGTWTQFQNVRAGQTRIKEIFAVPREGHPDAPPIHEIEGRIEFEDVSYAFSSSDKSIFHGVNFKIEPGETVAFVGSNGSGKTTTLNLMMGLVAPTEGRVLVDGYDLWQHDPATFRRQVLYLPQRPTLFKGTLLDNLTMFRGNRHVNTAMMFAERLGLHDAVSRMPAGYETQIEQSVSCVLPEGVRQRLALVRAFTLVEDPRLLLFDEANSYLDQETDQGFLDLLREYRGNCTMVIVSHRPSYLALADTTYRIADNRISPVRPTVSAPAQHIPLPFEAFG